MVCGIGIGEGDAVGGRAQGSGGKLGGDVFGFAMLGAPGDVFILRGIDPRGAGDQTASVGQKFTQLRDNP